MAPELRSSGFGLAGSSVPKMQHSPSHSTDPKVLRVQRNLEFGDRLCEDVRVYFFCGAVTHCDLVI
jgi:hypothetical protein